MAEHDFRLYTLAEFAERWRQKGYAEAFVERGGDLLIHEEVLISALTGIPRLLTFQQFSVKHPAFSARNLRYKREQIAGYENIFVRDRSRVLIDEIEFFRTLFRHNREAQARAGQLPT